MSAPRTFLARQVLTTIGRPMSVAEIAPLLGVGVKPTASAVTSLVLHNMARRVSVPGCKRFKYEAVS